MNRDLLSGEYKRFPKHWDVILFTKAFKDMTGGQTKIPKGDYLESGDIPIIDQGQDLIGGYTNERQAVCDIRLPCVVFGDHTKIFKFVTKPFALGADGVKVLSEANNIDPKFAYYFLNTLNLPNVGYSRHFRFLKRTFFPLPPLEEQRRIAAILDKADGVRRKRKEAIRLTEELLRSTFLEMFGDPVTNPKGWEVSPFGSLGKLDRGKSKHRPRNDPSLLGGKYPLIQTGDVANSKGVIKKYTQTYSDKGLAQSRMWPAGTLCITIAANIAQTGILTFDSCFPDSIVGFKPNNRVTTEYIQAWLGFLQPLLEDLAPQSAQKNINLQMLRELDVPVPPIDLQSKFSEFVERIGNNSRNYEKSEAVMDNLFNSLLQKAFRGEL